MKKNFLLLIFSLLAFGLSAQDSLSENKGSLAGIKTNIPYWGTATFNLGAEVRLARHWSLEAEVGLNPFDGKENDGSYGKSLKHLRVHPRTALLVLRNLLQTFYRAACTIPVVQRIGHQAPGNGERTSPGLGSRCGYQLRVFLDPFQALEYGSDRRCRLSLPRIG